jgi:serine/threonine protein kinase
LVQLFGERSDEVSKRAVAILERGLAEQPEDRDSLDSLESAFAELLGESIPPPPAPPARFWTEDQIIRFGNHDYRIVSRLGSGGVGTTFKVVHVDRSTGEDLGTYVAKVAHDRETGERVRRSYARVRPYLRHTGLSTIFEIAKEWQENQFIALLSWIPGTPLSDFIGVFPLLAEEQQEPSTEALALRWIEAVCEALDVLHQHGLVHGDVSPRNLIVWGGDIVLTDYDFVAKVGEPMASPGTVLYCAPSNEGTRLASPSDDVYALAATFFHVVFEKEPFRYGEKLDKSNGLNWEGIPRDEFPRLASWLDQATNPDESMRFRSAAEAREALTAATSSVVQQPSSLSTEATELAESLTLTTSRPQEGVLPQQLRQERVEWLQRLLQSYPASPWGNQETRGLDSEFASETYVQTPLEEALLKDIRERRARLVILCGNAGDGKTALLQHLAEQLGLRRPRSAERILEVSLDDGLTVRMNLDGSASWRGRSADEILDDFLEPFQYGPPEEDLVHLLAINDGRLLEWIESVKERIGEETPLTDTLSDLVRDEKPLKNSYTLKNSYIRFINLNQRSLVGGINTSENRIDTTFLERLVDRLYGGDKAAEIWAPCKSCSAQEYCEVYRAALVFGPSNLGSPVSQEVRKRARERLFELLQAVHLRGETHITMRELRSALVYILFGVHFCDEYHEGQEALPYWDRAFSANSPYRQGEVLAELARFDPAVEAHPQIDRYLQKETSEDSNSAAPSYPDLTVGSARRRAFFEWTEEYLEQVAGDPYGLGLARGRHLRDFRELPLMSPEEQSRICETLCKGISRLEELPPQALDRQGVVPLRVTPRTATETAFWVEKPLDAFRLEVDLPPEMEGLERLHRQVSLVYRYRSGHEERLRLGSDLFHHLLDLADGYQLGDISSDDTFAHLSIFVQRLVKEDERELLAWNPMQDETVYKVECRLVVDEEGPQQRLAISALAGRVAEQ